MGKANPLVVLIRYTLVAGLLWAIWTHKMWALQLTCTLAILHSEFIYLANRLKEIQIARMLKNVTPEKKSAIKTTGQGITDA